MALNDDIKLKIVERIKSFCANFGLPTPIEGTGIIGVSFRVVVKDKSNSEKQHAANVILQLLTLSDSNIIITLETTTSFEDLSSTNYSSKFIELVGNAIDRKTGTLFTSLKDFQNNNPLNIDIKEPSHFFIESINIDESIKIPPIEETNVNVNNTINDSSTDTNIVNENQTQTSNLDSSINSTDDGVYDDFINNDNISDQTGETQNTKKDVNVDNIDDSLVKDVKKNDYTKEKSDSQSAKENISSLGKGVGGIGGSQPAIKINGYMFSSREILRMELSSTLFLPTIELTVKLTTGIFISKHFPKDGDVVSVFIRSYNDIFKPISTDFLITHVDTSVSKDKEGSDITIFIYGILNINYMFAEVCKSLKDKTSFEALLEISKTLKLGFASNETKTDDKMNWICPYNTYKNWIDNITIHAYKDNQSFFDSWVDFYYILNFTNLNAVFSVSDSAISKDGLMMSSTQVDHNADDNISHYKTAHHFSNAPGMEKTNYYYDSLEFINNSGEIDILNGYKRYIQFYDIARRKNYENIKEKHDVLYIDPFSTEGVEKYKNMMRGRAKEDYYKSTNKYKWQGIQYSTKDNVGNTHKFWKLSEYINFQNLEFVDKMLLKIHLPKPNFNLYRGQRTPLSCIITKDIERGKIAGSVGKDDYSSLGITADRFISSNNYVIMGINIIYKQIDDEQNHDVSGKFEQEIILGRREWEIPTATWNYNETNPYKSNSL